MQIGKYVVHGLGMEGRLIKDGVNERNVRLRESMIEKVVAWCATREKVRYEEVLKRGFGALPLGMENSALLNMEAHFYNPDNLPGLHEIGSMTETPTSFERTLVSAYELAIDGHRYVIAGVAAADYEDTNDSSFVPAT